MAAIEAAVDNLSVGGTMLGSRALDLLDVLVGSAVAHAAATHFLKHATAVVPAADLGPHELAAVNVALQALVARRRHHRSIIHHHLLLD